MDWMFDVALWIAGPVIALLLVGFVLIGLTLFRKMVVPRIRVTHADHGFISPIVASIMGFYGLVLALVAVNVFETYSGASRIVSTEATSLAALYRDISEYPEPARAELQAALRDYVENLIEVAWPLQRKGRLPTGGIERMDRFQARMAAFEPATEGQKILHAETWRAYNHVIEARRARLDEVRTGLPGVMWLVVVLGAAIGLVSAFFFHVEDTRLHGTLVTLLGLFIASVIFVVFALDHPFRGDLGISSESYQLIYDQLMKR